MSLLESRHLPLGTPMPKFTLKDTEHRSYDSDHLFGKRGLLVAFTCNHCPYAVAVWPRLIALANESHIHGINTIAINPNINPDYPEDSPANMKTKIKEWGISFPYLIDETQKTAKDFKAQCTPDIYLFDHEHKLVYHGRIDNNWKDASKVTKNELKEALDSLIAGKPISSVQNPSMGCSIKWL